MAKVKTNVFMDMMMKAEEEKAAANNVLNAAREALRKAESEAEKAGKKMTELKRIQEMTGDGWEVKFGVWEFKGRDGASSYSNQAWKDAYKFRTAQFEFWVTIKERTDLKKQKYEVHISGAKSTTAAESWKGGYHDHDFIKDKYATRRWDSKQMKTVHDPIKGQELEKKFTSEADAQKYAEEWMERLVEDNQDEILQELNLYHAAKELKK